jgi:hypothetical protein
MRSVVGFIGQFLGMSLLGAMSIATPPSYPCENLLKLLAAQGRQHRGMPLCIFPGAGNQGQNS